MKTIIAGSRSILSLQTVETAIKESGFESEISLIVSGGAVGIDQLGEIYARNRNIPVHRFIPNWNDISDKPKSQIRYSKNKRPYWMLAGYKRNEDMAEFSDALIAVWDGKSKGTKHMIDTAVRCGLRVFVYKV